MPVWILKKRKSLVLHLATTSSIIECKESAPTILGNASSDPNLLLEKVRVYEYGTRSVSLQSEENGGQNNLARSDRTRDSVGKVR